VWLDARAPTPEQTRAVVDDVARAAAQFGGELVAESWTDTTEFADAGRIAAVLDDAPVLDTGAGHDAGILSAAGVPATMLFVRNPTGVSHSPAEHAERDDCLAGVSALASVVRELVR
jgi:N-carbamoyl-L-amino-acid hydrolase